MPDLRVIEQLPDRLAFNECFPLEGVVQVAQTRLMHRAVSFPGCRREERRAENDIRVVGAVFRDGEAARIARTPLFVFPSRTP